MLTVLGAAMAGLALSWGSAALWLDLHGRRARPRGRYDAIVVAGCAVLADGRPSAALRRRAECAAAQFHAGRSARIVLTGGIGRFPPSEAEVAARVCEAAGVPGHALLLEERSTTTAENARFARDLLDAHDLPAARVLVVSDSYHVYRCVRLFRGAFGEADGVGAMGPVPPRIRMALREVGALLLHLLRPSRG